MSAIPEGVPTFLRFRDMLRLLRVDPLNSSQVRYVRGQVDRKEIPHWQPRPKADRLFYAAELQEWAERTGARLDWEGYLEEELGSDSK